MKSNKRWGILVIATISLLFQGLIYAWSIFKTPIAEMFPTWTVSQLSMTFTISMSMFCIGGFLGGILSKKLSLRVKFFISAVCMFIAFWGVSMLNPAKPATALTMLYFFYAFFGGGGVGFAYNATVGSVTKWFPDCVGLASGIMLMGFGMGSLVLGSVASSMMANQGVPVTFKIFAVLFAVAMILSAFFIKLPTEADLEGIGATPAAGKAVNVTESKQYTPGEMLKTAKFWIFFAWVIFVSSAGLLVINSAANISVAYGGAAILGMIVSLTNGFGRVINGRIFDKKGSAIATLCCTLFMIIAGALLAVGGMTSQYIFILLGLIFVGLAFGGCPALSSAYASKTFGAQNFGTNFAILNFNLIGAAFIGPSVSSKLLEASQGSYITNFYAVLAFAIVGLVLWFGLATILKKEESK